MRSAEETDSEEKWKKDFHRQIARPAGRFDPALLSRSVHEAAFPALTCPGWTRAPNSARNLPIVERSPYSS
jgi:hypothetical protein